MWDTNPMPSSHRGVFWVLDRLVMKDDTWAVFRDKEQQWPEDRRNGALNKTPKNSENLPMWCYCISMVRLSPRSAGRKAPMNWKQAVWHVLVPDAPWMLSPVKNTFGTASCFWHWPNPDMWFEGNVIWRLSREQQERGCSTKEDNPGARGGSCPGRDGVLIGRSQYHSHHRRQVLWLQWPFSGAGPRWGTKDPVGATETLLPSELLQKTVEKF